jgi:kynurenine formamidase
MVANTGTYIDAPFDRYQDGQDLSQLDLTAVANLDGLVIHAPPNFRKINLDGLPHNGFKFFAVPAPVKGMGSFPVRAFAVIE